MEGGKVAQALGATTQIRGWSVSKTMAGQPSGWLRAQDGASSHPWVT